MDNIVDNLPKNPPIKKVLAFEDFETGSQYASDPVRLTQSRILEFAQVSGDRNPIHIDPQFAIRTAFKGTIAHGQLVTSIASGLAFQAGLLGPNIFALESSQERYFAPARPGDNLFAEVTIGEKDETAGKRFGRITWDTTVFKRPEAGDPVKLLEVSWVTLVFKRAFLPTTSPQRTLSDTTP